MDEYDIRKAFEEMELELIASMKRNLARHRKWETKEGMNWTMWQAEQLKTLENFRRSNQKLFDKKFSKLNKEIESFLKEQYETAGLDQEKAILRELVKGKSIPDIGEGLEGAFFSLNEDKMNALIKAVTDDMKTAETAMLRMVNDQYRSTIYNAQVMSNSGAFTLQQSIDKATKDFLKAGINCIQYKDGRRVNIASYAEMAIRTANKRAVLISEGDARNAYNVHTVRISKYGGCSETCLPWQGRIYVDDVYSGGTKEEAQEKKLPLLSEAIEGGLFHPNCRHRATTYFYDLKKSLGKIQEDGVENPLDEQEHRKNQLHIQQQKRMETGSLDQKNVADAKYRRERWEARDASLINQTQLRLSEDEQYAVNSYVSFDSYLINDALRNGYELDSRLQKVVSYLDSVLEKLPDYEGQVIRSLNFINQDQLSEFLEQYRIGETITYKAFTSCTASNTPYDPEATVQLLWYSNHGKNLIQFNQKEMEILYPRNSRFKILDFEYKDGTYCITMEEYRV